MFGTKEEQYRVLSIDIGVKHLGLSLSIITKEFIFSKIEWFELLDITLFTHKRTSMENCSLGHSKTYTDYLEHIFFDYQDIFDKADFILVERQPPGGYVVVEQLIFSRFRLNTILISPNSVHAYLGWNKLNLDYEQRKEASSTFSLKYLIKSNETLVSQFNMLYRKHDVADSICMLIYWLDKERKNWLEEQHKKRAEEKRKLAELTGEFNIDIFLEQFRFVNKDSHKNKYNKI